MADLLSFVEMHIEVCNGVPELSCACVVLPPHMCSHDAVPMQKFAAHYTSCVFLKFLGNANENTKYLFRDRLQTPLTPTFSFWRRGELSAALAFGFFALQADVSSAHP